MRRPSAIGRKSTFTDETVKLAFGAKTMAKIESLLFRISSCVKNQQSDSKRVKKMVTIISFQLSAISYQLSAPLCYFNPLQAA
jgi:hypothetical protein